MEGSLQYGNRSATLQHDELKKTLNQEGSLLC